MDRFEQIKKSASSIGDDYGRWHTETPGPIFDLLWAIEEIERLRKIEDAAYQWRDCLALAKPMNCKSILIIAMEENPRPPSDD